MIIKRIARVMITVSGILALIVATLAFTRVPFDLHRWLGEHRSQFSFQPEVLVMLGGSGMPSESNLIRLYYTARYAELYSETDIIIAHPLDTAVAESMKAYLIRHGIDSSRIAVMQEGTNTREQSMMIREHDASMTDKKIAIITSPENMYRTLCVFRKLEYRHIGGIAAFESAMFVDLDYKHKSIGGKPYVPDVSSNLGLRYNFWNYLKLEITCLREWVAIAYYWVNGWI